MREPLARTEGRLGALVLEEAAAAVRVRSAIGEGWVRDEDLATGLTGLERGGPRPPGPLPAQPADPDLLERAVRHLQPARGGTLGAYELWTDLEDPELLAALATRLDGIEELYSERYGLQPQGRPAETVVLFAEEPSYRAYEEGLPGVAGLDSAGHAVGGVVALYRGERALHELGSSLVHEVAHLLNRRAIGPALPPWLDEGIAGDLAYSAVGEDGRLLPGTVGGTLWAHSGEGHPLAFPARPAPRTSWRVEYFGGRAALVRLHFALQEGLVPGLEEMLSLEADAFVRHERSGLLYSRSAFLVRFLVDGPDAGWRAGFLRFLEGVAAGEAPSAGRLLAQIGTDAARLEESFDRWLELRARAVAQELGASLPELVIDVP